MDCFGALLLAMTAKVVSRPQRPRHPEADVVVSRVGIGLGANGGAERGFGAEPVAAAQGVAGATRLDARGAVPTRPRIVGAKTNPRPLPNTARTFWEGRSLC